MRLMAYVTPACVFLAVWIPVIDHYYIPRIDITNEMVETARRLPLDSVLDELTRFRLGLDPSWDRNEQLILAAEKILQGEIEIPGTPFVKIGMPFNVEDIERGSPSWQLQMAGFVIPKVLLKAYRVTGRDDFFRIAQEVILSWAAYERSAWLPRGFLWNDHAIAARVLVLAEFWRLYRNRPDYQAKVAKDILRLVARSGQLLAEPSQFTFSTNHGIMQNLALWHLCLAFPTLPHREQYRQLALNRMRQQMVFYTNDEGIVLEHSAGYHWWGVEFIGMAMRYLTLMDVSIPDEWKEKYIKAKDFLAQLKRPDGSLPMFGDTGDPRADAYGPLVTNMDAHGRSEILDYQGNWIPERLNSLYPVAGYSVWWDGLAEWPRMQKLNQTTVAWSYFPGHGHKHADEMSVLLWAGGQTWWTNVGYWPYGANGRLEADSWNGSNAPHLVTEDANSPRNTKLYSYGWSEDISVIDLQRKGQQEYVARRQVIHLKPNLWVVIDYTSGNPNSHTTTVWTTSHDVKLTEGEIPGSYDLKAEDKDVHLTTFIFGSLGTKIEHFRGSFRPFAGWVVVGQVPKPTSAIVIEQPTNNSWAVAVWSLENATGPTLPFREQPYMQYWKSSEEWKIVLPVESGLINISREGTEVYMDGNRKGDLKKITLVEAPELSDRVAELRTAYESTADKYPKFNDVLDYRWKVTYFLTCILVLQEGFFFICAKIDEKHYVRLRVLSVFGWAGVGMWLITVYFRT